MKALLVSLVKFLALALSLVQTHARNWHAMSTAKCRISPVRLVSAESGESAGSGVEAGAVGKSQAMGEQMTPESLRGVKFRRMTWIAAAFVGVAGLAQIIFAQPQAGSEIDVVQVRPNLYMLAGAGGNIGVQIGETGVVLVDSGLAQMTDQVMAEVKKLSEKPVRLLINTSADADHVGGNERISAAGRNLAAIPGGIVMADNGGHAGILAQENVLVRMSAPTGKKSPYPTFAQPSDTFLDDRLDLYLNGEPIETIYQPAAHTDGDSFVFFRRSDTVVAGDVFDLRQFPVIDIDKGGSIQGEIAALNHLLELTVSEVPLGSQEGGTMVIPGHGRLCDQADVLEYRDMVTIIRDRVQDMITKGMTLDQIEGADPTRDYRKRYGPESGPWTTRMFVEAVYKSLTQKKK
jgi:glyoxylase-like metal-dependent hydrolase (beta-lactamase superfamily II)